MSRPAPTRSIARRFEADLSAPVLAAGNRLPALNTSPVALQSIA
jgi:hypothetical protein